MTAATHVAYDLAAYLGSAELVGATAFSRAKASLAKEEVLARSYVESITWADTLGFRVMSSGTAQSERAPLVITYERSEDSLVAQLRDFSTLPVGWDGEGAARPNYTAIADALHFVRRAGQFDLSFSPSLHVDGSVILDVDDADTSFRFPGDGTVVYSSQSIGHGIARLSSEAPELLARAFG